MEPISTKVRATTIAVTLLVALIGPIVILQLVAPERLALSFVGVRYSPTPDATRPSSESPATTTATALGSVTAVPSWTATPRIAILLFEGAYVDGVSDLAGGRSMVRIALQGSIQGSFRMEAGSWVLKPYACFIPEAYTNRLYCHGPGIPSGETIRVQVFEGISEGGDLVFEASHFVLIYAPSSTPKPGSAGPAPTMIPSATPLPASTTTFTPTKTPSASPTATPTFTPTQSPPAETAVSASPTPSASPDATPSSGPASNTPNPATQKPNPTATSPG